MTQEQAIQVLTQSLDQAFRKGVYSLQDAGLVVQALNVLLLKLKDENKNNDTPLN